MIALSVEAARALRPNRVMSSPSLTQVDAVQDVRLAVEGVQVGHAQHLVGLSKHGAHASTPT
jgi:hypothetical protein